MSIRRKLAETVRAATGLILLLTGLYIGTAGWLGWQYFNLRVPPSPGTLSASVLQPEIRQGTLEALGCDPETYDRDQLNLFRNALQHEESGCEMLSRKLARAILFERDGRPAGALQEGLLAVRLENELGFDEILSRYLSAHLGDPANPLTGDNMVMLASIGMLAAPQTFASTPGNSLSKPETPAAKAPVTIQPDPDVVEKTANIQDPSETETTAKTETRNALASPPRKAIARTVHRAAFHRSRTRHHIGRLVARGAEEPTSNDERMLSHSDEISNDSSGPPPVPASWNTPRINKRIVKVKAWVREAFGRIRDKID